jgi:ATP-dependent DNA helicase RecG
MIAKRIDRPESKMLEFKRNSSSPSAVLRSLVAFANSASGHRIPQEADHQTIVGVENPLDLRPSCPAIPV